MYFNLQCEDIIKYGTFLVSLLCIEKNFGSIVSWHSDSLIEEIP